MRKTFLVALIAIVVIVTSFLIANVFFTLFSLDNSKNQIVSTSTPAIVSSSVVSDLSAYKPCLADNEYADYPLDPKYDPAVRLPKLPLVISVRDRSNSRENSSFQVDNVSSFAHPLELHRCGVYIIRQWGFDIEHDKFAPDYRTELWRYSYSGSGKKLLDLSPYSFDFRIDPLERYIDLEKSYLGQDDHAFVIKDIKSLDDVFVLKQTDLLKMVSGTLPGSFDLGEWQPDGRYLWNDTYDGPFETAWFRIDTNTWKADVFPPPPGIQSGVERGRNAAGWIAYVDITSFTGDTDITKQIEQDARKQGQQKHLWLYNFFTKQKNLVVSADPAWRFNISITSTTLIYHLPKQGTSTYTIPQ